MYKVKLFGWPNEQLGQLPRIKQGLISQGCEIVDENTSNPYSPDFIYVHDSSQYDEAINYHEKCTENTKLLMKVLDLGLHCNNDIELLKQKLLKSDLVLANSQTVQKEIKQYLGLNSYVVYDAVKDVYHDTNIFEKQIDFLSIGRLVDRNKRFALVKELFNFPENKNRKLAAIGPENPNIGSNYLGIVNDDDLNYFYNISKFTLCISKNEGLNLPLLESCICGSVPIVCSDMSTASELISTDFICEPNAYSINEKIKEIEKDYCYYVNLALEYGNLYKRLFDKVKIAHNIVNAYKSICINGH